MADTILKIENLKMYFPIKKGIFSKIIGYVKAVDNINLKIEKGESWGLVGESGSGKTTFGRSILNLVSFTDGKVYFKGKQVNYKKKKEVEDLRKKVQIVFQDPYGSLNPRKTIGNAIMEPLVFHKIANKKTARQVVYETLLSVGLKENDFYKYPHEFSGGQRQRIGIARALILKPEVIILDEPVSSLDVSVQAQILNLLKDLQKKFDLTYLFIAHNLNVVRFFCNKVAVMYLGKIMEIADSETLFSNPLHPYTKLLIRSIPEVDKKKNIIDIDLDSESPSLSNVTEQCRFYERCDKKNEKCEGKGSELVEKEKNHFVRCFL